MEVCISILPWYRNMCTEPRVGCAYWWGIDWQGVSTSHADNRGTQSVTHNSQCRAKECQGNSRGGTVVEYHHLRCTESKTHSDVEQTMCGLHMRHERGMGSKGGEGGGRREGRTQRALLPGGIKADTNTRSCSGASLRSFLCAPETGDVAALAA